MKKELWKTINSNSKRRSKITYYMVIKTQIYHTYTFQIYNKKAKYKNDTQEATERL